MASQEPICLDADDGCEISNTGAAQLRRKRIALNQGTVLAQNAGRVVQFSNCKVIVRKVIVPRVRPRPGLAQNLGEICINSDEEDRQSTTASAVRGSRQRQESASVETQPQANTAMLESTAELSQDEANTAMLKSTAELSQDEEFVTKAPTINPRGIALVSNADQGLIDSAGRSSPTTSSKVVDTADVHLQEMQGKSASEDPPVVKQSKWDIGPQQASLVGKFVVVQGLSSKPELNTLIGVVKDFDGADNRYTVQIEGNRGLFKLKPEHLKDMSHIASATAPEKVSSATPLGKCASPFAIGKVVQVYGLVKKPELNGARGIVKEFIAGRCIVDIACGRGRGLFKLRPSNIRDITQSSDLPADAGKTSSDIPARTAQDVGAHWSRKGQENWEKAKRICQESSVKEKIKIPPNQASKKQKRPLMYDPAKKIWTRMPSPPRVTVAPQKRFKRPSSGAVPADSAPEAIQKARRLARAHRKALWSGCTSAKKVTRKDVIDLDSQTANGWENVEAFSSKNKYKFLRLMGGQTFATTVESSCVSDFDPPAGIKTLDLSAEGDWVADGTADSNNGLRSELDADSADISGSRDDLSLLLERQYEQALRQKHARCRGLGSI